MQETAATGNSSVDRVAIGGGPMGTVTLKRSAAFTLVELLVVLGIVAILLALLLSVFAGVRAAAAKAACANNLRQIGNGLIIYDRDYGRIPGSEGHKTLSDLPSFVDVLK